MPDDLTLSELHRHLTEDDGPLPDGTVVGSTAQDWRSVLDLVAAQGWPMTSLHTSTEAPDEDELLRAGNTLAVWPAAGVQINFFPDQEILFDLDRRQIRDEAAATALGGFLRALGRHLGREVAITYEGSSTVFLRYDPQADAFEFCA